MASGISKIAVYSNAIIATSNGLEYKVAVKYRDWDEAYEDFNKFRSNPYLQRFVRNTSNYGHHTNLHLGLKNVAQTLRAWDQSTMRDHISPYDFIIQALL